MSWWATPDVRHDRALFQQRAAEHFGKASDADLRQYRPGTTPMWQDRVNKGQKDKRDKD